MLIHCPTCSTEIEVAESQVGAKGRCPGCAAKFIVPESPDHEIEIIEPGQDLASPGAEAHPKLRVPEKPAATRLVVGGRKPGPRVPVKRPGAAPAPAPSPEPDTSPAEKAAAGPVLKTGGAPRSPSRLALRAKANQSKRGNPGVMIGIGAACLLLVVCVVVLSGGGKDKTANKPEPEAEKPPPAKRPTPEVAVAEPEPEPVDPEPDPNLSHFDRVIHPMLDKYCNECHDEVNEEGGVDLERFASERQALRNPMIWEMAKAQLEIGSMPPRKKRKQPTEEERQQFIAWIDSVTEKWELGQMGRDPGRTTIRRLNKSEYNYTIRDLIGLRLRPADNFPEDGGGEAGFDNNADALFLPPLLMENYVEAAGEIVDAVYRNSATYTRYLFAFPGGEVGPEDAARKVLNHWASMAYRRPADKAEVERLVGIFKSETEKKKRYRDAMKLPLLAILISPNFLYRAEIVQPGGKAYKVDQFDLASRLSYFLWSSMPDEQLFAAAKAGKLHDPAVLEAQVRRMLADEKAKSLSMHFAGQWLKWEELRSRTNPDRKRYPSFDFQLRVSLYRESSVFFENLVRDNGSALDLIDSDYTYLNGRLAQHYGIPGVTGTGFQKVSLKDPNRGGVLGMGSVLAATSLPLRTSPSIRGAYVLTELLGTPPPPPPMDVPQLPEDDREIKGAATFRDALIDHRVIPSCKSCHEMIDPLGFGMENFDAIGRWRTTQNGKPIDTAGELPDGTEFSSPRELKGILMSRKELFAQNMVEKALSYALGRELSAYDRATVRDIKDKLIADNYKIQTLFVEIARSYPFLNCRGDDFKPE